MVTYLNRNRSIFRRIHCLHHVRIRRFHVLVQGIFANTDKGIKYSSHCWFKNDLLVVYNVSKENCLGESLLEFFSMDFDRCWLFLFWFLHDPPITERPGKAKSAQNADPLQDFLMILNDTTATSNKCIFVIFRVHITLFVWKILDKLLKNFLKRIWYAQHEP